MPQGIVATIDGGYATLDFLDPALRGPALAALIELAGPNSIETITRRGPRRTYRVLTDNAVEAGLIDGDEDPRVPSAGHDSGTAAALVAADPNVNVGPDHANWHTPTAEYTSANKYVGDTTVTEARAAAAAVYTGTAETFGGSKASDTALHTDVIAHVAGHRVIPEQFASYGDDVPHPGQEANARLATIKATESSDPQGATMLPIDRPGGAKADQVATPHALAANPTDPAEVSQPANTDPTDPNAVEQPTPTLAGPAAYPEGEPSIEWKRGELDAYAAASPREIDTTDLSKKQDVLDAIGARVAELNK